MTAGQRPLLSPAALERLAGQIERRSFRTLVDVLQRVRARLPLSDLERAIVARNLDAAIEAVGLEPIVNSLYEIQTLSTSVRAAAWDSALGQFPVAVTRQPMVDLSLTAFAGENPNAVAALQRQDLRRIQDIRLETERAIRESIARSIETGLAPRETAVQLRAVVGLNRNRALAVDRYRVRLVAEDRPPDQVERMVQRYGDRQLAQRAQSIATTETFQALNDGRKLQWERLKQSGAVDGDDWEQEWVTAADERTCPQCAPFDGARAPIGGLFVSNEGTTSTGPTLHPNCVLGDSLITAAPRIAAVSDRIYCGPIRVIRTAGGKELTCTPNHPILTLNGFIPASTLDVGSDVVGHGRIKRPGIRHNQDQHVPARIEEIAEAFRCSGSVTSAEVPVAAPDFHGDGVGSEIAVIRADLLLGNRDDSANPEQFVEAVLGRGFMGSATLSRCSSLELFGQIHSTTSNRLMRSGNLSSPLLLSHARPFDSFSLALAPSFESVISEATVDNQTRHAERLSQAIDGLAGMESGEDLVLGQLMEWLPAPLGGPTGNSTSSQLLEHVPPTDSDLVRHLLHGHAFDVERDRVIAIEDRFFDGHVYNLETEEGWFAANGIITHNCRCVTRLVLKGFRAGESTSPVRLAILGR